MNQQWCIKRDNGHLKPISPQNLDRESVLANLRTMRLGRTLQVLDKCTSTNDVATRLAGFGAPHGYTVIAEEQAAGRGRQGRPWLSPRGGIWMTIIVRPPFMFNTLNALPLIGALAVAKAINSSLNVKSRVRWPNDVVYNDYKVAGVLAETKIVGNQIEYALLGIGINANFHINLMREIAATSTSLLDMIGSPIDREALICSVLVETENVSEIVSSGRDNAAVQLLREFDCSRGRHVRITVEGGEVVGLLEDYEAFTKVRIKAPEGSRKVLETNSAIKVDYTDS